MSKRLGKLPKNLKMPITVEARELLWAAVPPAAHDNRKSWFTRAARALGWRERRVRAIFHCEARVITAEEWRTLNQRLDALKAAERRHEDEVHELREAYRVAGARVSGFRRDPVAMVDQPTPPVGPRPAADHAAGRSAEGLLTPSLDDRALGSLRRDS